ncbi:tRNA (guanine-N(7)-)-methyltransferase non-catalytic subunit trm82 [Pestalotiopsis sp. IQ-011]
MDPTPAPSEKKRTKTPKPRNSEARKEQNRIASRAYNQILNIEDPTNNPPSSPSDAGGGSSLSGLSIAATSREASRSPAPAPQDRAAAATSPPPVTTTWHADNGSYHSAVADPFEGDMWFGEYDHGSGGGMFGADRDFMPTYHHVHHQHHRHSADAAALGDYSACYPAPDVYQHAPPVAAEPKLPLQSEQNSAMAVALDAYSRLNSTQQDQMLNIIHKRRHPDQYTRGSNIRTWGENI